MDDEIKRSEDTLQLLREIPQASLISRAYRKFKNTKNYSPCRGFAKEDANVKKEELEDNFTKEVNTMVDDIRKFTEEMTMSKSPDTK
mmetsp:Transcript_16688/g.14602  ORF Transcript_16688/g.14602 Transcript_16688/m.14602 type:complete len:87 (+) Transcript_16688:456-716(+)